MMVEFQRLEECSIITSLMPSGLGLVWRFERKMQQPWTQQEIVAEARDSGLKDEATSNAIHCSRAMAAKGRFGSPFV